MQTVAIISQKGGAGKTTLAIHLAAAGTAGLLSLVTDRDPQATACTWASWRGRADPDVLDCAAHALLPRKLQQAASLGAQQAIIDTPSASASLILRLDVAVKSAHSAWK
jgi:chromosome partitioning protein